MDSKVHKTAPATANDVLMDLYRNAIPQDSWAKSSTLTKGVISVTPRYHARVSQQCERSLLTNLGGNRASAKVVTYGGNFDETETTD